MKESIEIIFKKLYFGKPQNTYFVYKNKDNYIDVVANTAYEAYSKSNITDPIKIVSIASFKGISVIDKNILSYEPPIQEIDH